MYAASLKQVAFVSPMAYRAFESTQLMVESKNSIHEDEEFEIIAVKVVSLERLHVAPLEFQMD